MMEVVFPFGPADPPPDDDVLSEEIARLEGEIEELGDALERCRKVGLLAKVAMIAGGAWLIAYVLGIVGFNAVLMMGSIAAVLGGVVASGSNATTTSQTEEALRAAEARRAELIGKIDLRVVGSQNLLQ